MDSAHKEVDRLLEKLEKKINNVYTRAQEEIDKKTKDYFERLDRSDKSKREKVEKGKMSQADYEAWKKGALLHGEHWECMRKTITGELLNANKTAISYVNNELPQVYSLGYNAIGSEVSSMRGISFELVDAYTVKNLVINGGQKLLPYKEVDADKDKKWNTRKLNSEMLQGIIQGESIPKIAKRLEKVSDMNRASSVRNARTMCTSAENKGRIDSYEYAESLGIVMKKMWLSTHDGRTRPEHNELDGVEEEVDEPFINGFGEIMYPGDPDAEPENVYNCRCTLVSDIKGFKGATSGKTYWLDDGYKVVQGKNITESWERRSGDYDYEIEDVINAQGFDGTPRIVSADEFDEYVKSANGGQGFVAQRSYSAPDQETLDAYRAQLYHGDWYVDCSTGGAQYGQGMYCAADYTGNLSSGIKNEMSHYQGLGKARLEGKSIIDLPVDTQNSIFERIAAENGLNKKDPNYNDYMVLIKGSVNPTAYNWQEISKAAEKIGSNIDNNLISKIASEANKYRTEAVSYTETMTLDRSARIVSFREINDIRMGNLSLDYRDRFIDAFIKNEGFTDDQSTFIKYNLQGWNSDRKITWEQVNKAAMALGKEGREEMMMVVEKIGTIATQKYNEEHDRRIEQAKMYQQKFNDIGSLAAALGYDAINAEGHGQSGSYTVILNRTKLIIKEPEK